MKYTNNALNILTARAFPKKGPAWIYNNLKGNDDIETLIQKLETHEYEFRKKRDSIESAINKLSDSLDGIVAFGDQDFPYVRGNVKAADKPFALFYKGDIGLLKNNNLNVAVIGVLNPDEKIELTETLVTKEILKHGATIVSGLALGCDSIAHRTALDNNGKTIAILPCSLNKIIPEENTDMAKEIVEHGGLLISEYYEPAQSRNEMISRFVVRDRLQAMFSDVILLAASYAQNTEGHDSGSRHAMGKAKDYGIKRAVVYNEIKHKDNPMYELNRQILEEDHTVLRIDSTNMEEMVKKMISKQVSLF
ncbi:MAG: DNA-processing protein DprA [Paludibacteraceae bacterium]|nr:DNA-processing protein DprA [Paludibacteraceae bacterium]